MNKVVRYQVKNGGSAYRITQVLPGEKTLTWLDCQKGKYVSADNLPADALTGDHLSGPFDVPPGQDGDIVAALLKFISSVEVTGGISGGTLMADPEWWDLRDDYEAACAAVRKKKLINGRYK